MSYIRIDIKEVLLVDNGFPTRLLFLYRPVFKAYTPIMNSKYGYSFVTEYWLFPFCYLAQFYYWWLKKIKWKE